MNEWPGAGRTSRKSQDGLEMRALVWGLGVIGVSALLSTASVPASAAVLDVSDILTQFNAVVTGSFSSGHDVEGRLVAGAINGGASSTAARTRSARLRPTPP
jgi:hypothetical protein